MIAQRTLRLIKGYFFPLILLLAGILIFSKKEQLLDIGRLVRNMKPLWLVAALCMQYLTYVTESFSYGSVLRLWRRGVSHVQMMRRIIVSMFIASTVPSLSLAGNIYIGKKFSDDGLTKNDAIQTTLIHLVTYYLSIFIFASFSYLYLWTHNELTVVEVAFFFIFFVFACFILWLGYYGTRKHGKLGVYYEKIMRKVQGVARKLFGEHEYDAENYKGAQDEGTEREKRPPVIVWGSLGWQIVRMVADSITLYFIFFGFGYDAHFGIVTVGFAMATIFGLLSIFPGGVGQYEAAQILVYGSLGVPVQIAVAATLVYRLLAFWLPIPLGAYLYKREGRIKSILRHV